MLIPIGFLELKVVWKTIDERKTMWFVSLRISRENENNKI